MNSCHHHSWCFILIAVLFTLVPLLHASVFTCDSGTLSLPASHINDDYCDCIDGTDEPLTSACSTISTHATFLCENKGYQPQRIPTSRIRDAVCDCCDGSDERGTDTISWSISCPNTCAEQWESHLSHVSSLITSYERGLAAQSVALSYIPEITAYLKNGIKVMEQEQQVLQHNYQKALSSARSSGATEPPPALTAAENALRLSMLRVETLRRLQDVTVTDKKGSKTKSKGQIQLHVAKIGQKSKHWLATVNKNTKCQQYIWQQKRYGAFGASIDEYRMELCPLQYAIQWQHTSDPEEARKIKNLQSWNLGTWDGRIQVLHKNHSKMEERKNALKGKSSEKKKASSESDTDPLPEAPTFIMRYVDGEQCWNGPKRSVTVVHECGERPQITQVRENGKCSYEFTFVTPMACDPQHLITLRAYYDRLTKRYGSGSKSHDEL